MVAVILLAFTFLAIMAHPSPVIRWTSPTGGDWNDSANWDLNRVPLVDDHIVFDLDAKYIVTVCGERPMPWQMLRVDRGEVKFNLCGGGFVTEYIVDGTKWYGPAIQVGTSGCEGGVVVVTFSNGVVFSNGPTYDNSIRLGNESGCRATLIVESTSELGAISEATLYPDSNMILVGDALLVGSGVIEISAGSSMVVSGQLVAGEFANITVGGLLDISGSLEGRESNLFVTGEMVLRSGSVVYDFGVWGAMGILRPENGSSMYLNAISGIALDLREGVSGEFLDLWGYPFPFLSSVYFMLDGKPNWVPPTIKLCSGDYWGLRDCEVAVFASELPSVGSSQLVAAFDRCRSLDAPVEDGIVLPSGEIHGQHYVTRIGIERETVWGMYVISVPESWCPVDINMDNELNFFDIVAFLNEFADMSALANINNDFAINFFDLSDFINLLVAGCR